MTVEKPQAWIAGFWRRCLAFLIDFLVLVAVGYVLSLFLSEFFASLGGWGRAVGFVIGLIYFSVMDSRLCGGQTLGKRLCKIKVVTASNANISLPLSALRYSFLGLPGSLNGAQFPTEFLMSFWAYPVSLVVFGGLLSTAYLLIFNRGTRQGLHDLVSHTYVVNLQATPDNVPLVWTIHKIIVGLILVLAALAPLLGKELLKNNFFAGLIEVQQVLLKQPGVNYVAVSVGQNFNFSAGQPEKNFTYINADIFLVKNNIHDKELARHLQESLLMTFPQFAEKDLIQINLVYGYDIGLVQKYKFEGYEYHPPK
ncbi:RDD family protein [Undibacterium sp. Di27W]|uniref:RDD family protein n=1 Tax=Undibacterium sp. Di27W TaxID=3413036 RepID=UPI003BF04E34